MPASQAPFFQRDGYHHIEPWTNLPVTRENAQAVLHEADRALAACPEGATFAWAYKANALALLGRHAEAHAAAARVPRALILD